MDNLEQILGRLETVVKRIEDMTFLLAISQRNEVYEYALEVFGNSKKRAEIYLALDGQRSVAEISELLGMKRPNVSIEIKNLLEGDLIERDDSALKGYAYRRRSAFDLIGVPNLVRSKFKLS